MPIDAPLNTSWSASWNGVRNSSCRRSATLLASATLGTSSSRMVNSSPLSRATVSPGRRMVWSLRPTSMSSWSPSTWPRLSLITLKRSMSSTSTEKLVWCRRFSSARRCSRRSRKSARLGKPVRESWNASWSSLSATRRRSVTSVPTAEQPTTRLSRSRKATMFHSTTRLSPERVEQAAGQHRLEIAALPAFALVLRDAELEPVLPQHLVPLVPRHPQHRVVAELDAALGIELEDEELRLLQQLAQPAISLALRRLRAHPFADVEDRAADHLLAADDHGALVRFQVDQLAIPARGAHDVGHPALPLRFRQREIGGMDQLEKRAADQLLRLPADHPSRGRVDPDDAVARQDVETCEAVIEQEGEMVREHRGLLDNTAKIPGGYKATCSHGAPDSLRPCARSSAIRTRSHFLPATASPCPSTGCCGSASSPRECWVRRSCRSPTSSIALRSCWPTPRSIWTRSSPERFRSPNSAGLDSPGARRWSRGRGRASSAPSPPPARRCGTGWREISPAARTTPTPTAGRASASSTTRSEERGRSSGRGSSTAPWWSIWTSTRATGRRRSSPATRASSPSPCTARRTSPFASSARRWTSSSRTGVEILNILRRSRSTCRRCSIALGRTSSSSRPGSIRSSTTSSGASSSRRQGFDCATASWPAPRATAAFPWC